MLVSMRSTNGFSPARTAGTISAACFNIVILMFYT
jgi:hypothetical protein